MSHKLIIYDEGTSIEKLRFEDTTGVFNDFAIMEFQGCISFLINDRSVKLSKDQTRELISYLQKLTS